MSRPTSGMAQVGAHISCFVCCVVYLVAGRTERLQAQMSSSSITQICCGCRRTMGLPTNACLILYRYLHRFTALQTKHDSAAHSKHAKNSVCLFESSPPCCNCPVMHPLATQGGMRSSSVASSHAGRGQVDTLPQMYNQAALPCVHEKAHSLRDLCQIFLTQGIVLTRMFVAPSRSHLHVAGAGGAPLRSYRIDAWGRVQHAKARSTKQRLCLTDSRETGIVPLLRRHCGNTRHCYHPYCLICRQQSSCRQLRSPPHHEAEG